MRMHSGGQSPVGIHLRQVLRGRELDYCFHREESPERLEALPNEEPVRRVKGKRRELIKSRKELEALRLAARLLGAEDPDTESGQDQAKVPRVVQMP